MAEDFPKVKTPQIQELQRTWGRGKKRKKKKANKIHLAISNSNYGGKKKQRGNVNSYKRHIICREIKIKITVDL